MSERVVIFFFQAEDGIRDTSVTGVQTCAPPILEQTSSAIDEAHQQGIIHRDLKPDNIWLEPNRRGGYTVKVLDFGLAKLGEIPVNEPRGTSTSPTSNSLKVPRGLPTVATDQRNTQVSEGKTHARIAEGSEAATRLQTAPIAEDATQILVEPA